MTNEDADQKSPGLLGALLAPLRAPERVVRDIERIAASLLLVEGVVQQHLTSVDARAGALRDAVGTLQDTLGALRSPLERIDRKVTQLAKLEQVITVRMTSCKRRWTASISRSPSSGHSSRSSPNAWTPSIETSTRAC